MNQEQPVYSSQQHPDPLPGMPVAGSTTGSPPTFPTPQQHPGQSPYPAPAYGQPRYPAPAYGPLGPPVWRDPLPPAGTEYHRFFRTPRNAWWKGVVAIGSFIVGYLLITSALTVAAMIIDFATGRAAWESVSSGAIEFTPALFLATNIGNALAIPLAMLVQWLVWGQPVRWLHSVTGYVRWRLMARCALIVVPLWVAYMVISAVAFPAAAGTPSGSGFTGESVALLIIMLLTTPLQAAGEEYGTRGLIMRAAGSWTASPLPGLIIAALVPSVIFMLAHRAGDPWLNAYFFVFGVTMSVLAWRTGGLEAGIVVHAVNNMLAFGIVILAGQEINLDRSAGVGGAFMLVPIAALLVVTAVLVLLTQRWQVRRTYQPIAG